MGCDLNINFYILMIILLLNIFLFAFIIFKFYRIRCKLKDVQKSINEITELNKDIKISLSVLTNNVNYFHTKSKSHFE